MSELCSRVKISLKLIDSEIHVKLKIYLKYDLLSYVLRLTGITSR